MKALSHSDILSLSLVKLDNGVIAAHCEGQPLRIVAMPTGIDPHFERLLLSSAQLYRTLDGALSAMEALLAMAEEADAQQIVQPLLNLITALKAAQRTSTEGFEAVAADINKGKAIRDGR
jgi:hypothetical protein